MAGAGTQARPLTHQRAPAVEKLRQEARANLDDLGRRIVALEKRVAVLERRDAWFRETFFTYIQGLAASVAYTVLTDLPE